MQLIKNLLLVALAFVIALAIQNYSFSNTLKFVQLSDIHYTTKREDTTFKMLSKSKVLLKDAISQINTIPNLDLVVVTGDLTDAPKVEEVEEVLPIMNTLNTPWYLSFGNHDIAISGKLTKKKYIELLQENNSAITSDKSYYSFYPKKGYKMIILDCIIDDRVTGNGYIPEEEMKWLEEELANAKDDAIMLFMHCPLKEPFKSSGHRLLNATELNNLLIKQHKPIAVFTGHYHASKVFLENNILYVCSPSLVTYPNAFRLINVTNESDKITYKLTFYETGRKDIQSTAKLKLFASQTYAGGKKDQNATYTLLKNTQEEPVETEAEK